MARTGVIAIALLLISGLFLSKGTRASHAPADRVGLPAAPATERGELMFAAVLFAMLLGAFVAAGGYPAQAAVLPRLASAVTMALLVAAFLPQIRARRSQPFPAMSPRVINLAGPAIRWILLFLISIWSFGFIIGAPLAILGYLVFPAREHPARSVALGVCTYLVLEALHRLLGVSFWEGALQAWFR